MRIEFPNCTQAQFDKAVETLEVCKITDKLPVLGFTRPFFAPGGLYGDCWWNIDSSVALAGYKWIDRKFAENSLLNFVDVQRADGRIPLWGYDRVDPYDEEISSLPKLFEAAYGVLCGSDDIGFVTEITEMLDRYMGWWLKCRRDAKTGLVSSVFEETFIPWLSKSGERAAVDTNVEIAVGCKRMSALYKRLGNADKQKFYDGLFAEMRDSINKYLWNEEKGAYYPLMLGTGKFDDILMASAFIPLRFGIADADKKRKLLRLLTDESEFGWGGCCLTSVSKKDKAFTTTRGDYKGNPSWSGNVWTLINEAVVCGLKESGERALSASLAYMTVGEFAGKFYEFLNPEDGSGHGVVDYAWTASQFIRLIVEEIFGLSCDAATGTVEIAPNLPKEACGRKISLSGVPLFGGAEIDVEISEKGGISYSLRGGKGIKVTVAKG